MSATVADAVRELKELYERFREVRSEQVEPIVYGVLADLTAAQAIQACREFGLRVPNSKRAVVEGISRAILERREAWIRCSHIGGSPFTL